MSKICVELPKELQPFHDDLGYFIHTMVKKLYTNRHKGFSDGPSLQEKMEKLSDEVEELKGALDGEGQFAAFVEACDVANMAFLVALTAIRKTKAEYEEERKNGQ